MKIYNQKPMNVLYDIVKNLGIPIFKNTIREDINSIPVSYLLLRSDTSDAPDSFGDGSCQIRSSDCSIDLISKGFSINSTDTHYVNASTIETCLKSLDVNYNKYNLGYDKDMKTSQITFALTIKYYE